jgi:6-phosphogluconolactonase
MNYRLDRMTGKIHPNNNQKSISLEPGEGPRHCVFHPNGRYLYLVTEIGNHIYTYSFNEKTAVLTEKNKISTLPDNYSGTSHSAEITISKDGKYIYTSNRGHDSIAGFSVNQNTGELTSIGFFECGGKGPRHICFGPSENFLVVANKDSNKVTNLGRDIHTGMLGNVSNEVDVPAASCVEWTILPNEEKTCIKH